MSETVKRYKACELMAEDERNPSVPCQCERVVLDDDYAALEQKSAMAIALLTDKCAALERERDEFNAGWKSCVEDLRKAAEICKEAEQRAEIAERALDQIRDAVLNERFAMAENGMTSDQVNDVLAVIDQFAPRLAAEQPKEKP